MYHPPNPIVWLAWTSDTVSVALHSHRGGGSGYVVIQRYGEQYERKGGSSSKKKRPRAVRLLYSGSNHYDLLLSK